MELEDWEHGLDFRGPVGRALDAGASAYYVAASTEALADFLLDALGARDRDEKPAQSHELGPTVDDAIFQEVEDALARRQAYSPHPE